MAYWHSNFVPRRNPDYDYSHRLDGSNPATDWKGLHRLHELVQVKNPKTGWLQNCNATPFTVAGPTARKHRNILVTWHLIWKMLVESKLLLLCKSAIVII
ncbi:MAG: penicillin acylase family protein [Saprospiraceae bacterium]